MRHTYRTLWKMHLGTRGDSWRPGEGAPFPGSATLCVTSKSNPLRMGVQPNCGLIMLHLSFTLQNLNEPFHHTGSLSGANVMDVTMLRKLQKHFLM